MYGKSKRNLIDCCKRSGVRRLFRKLELGLGFVSMNLHHLLHKSKSVSLQH